MLLLYTKIYGSFSWLCKWDISSVAMILFIKCFVHVLRVTTNRSPQFLLVARIFLPLRQTKVNLFPWKLQPVSFYTNPCHTFNNIIYERFPPMHTCIYTDESARGTEIAAMFIPTLNNSNTCTNYVIIVRYLSLNAQQYYYKLYQFHRI